MPQIYPRNEPRRRSSSSASSSSVSSSSTTPLRVVDADDSIVLSDLVRTGEASRLRRRGAMRIDHSAVSNARVSSPTRSLVVVERPSWDSDFDLDLSLLPEGHLGRTTSRYARRRQRPSRRFGPYATGTVAEPEEADEDVHTLVCGAEIAEYSSDESEPFKPSVLPLYPPLQHAKEKEVKRSTGCGTVVHMRATPHPRVGLWSACGTASSSVVPLEAIYFDTREAAKFVRSSCGCVKEGVGCAVCGNPLGIRYIPCKSASDSFFCGRHNDKSHATRLRGPEGPQYWQASSSHASDHTIFTFFSDAVTPTPSFEFPVQKPGARQRHYSNASDLSLDLSYLPPVSSQGFLPDPVFSDDEGDSFPGRGDWQSELTPRGEEDPGAALQPPSNMILDRFAASSPTPLSDGGDETAPHWNQPRIRTYSRARRPRIYPALPVYDSTVPSSYSPPVSFYQQQVIGAWERERELEDDRRRPRGGRGFDPDGESVAWGVMDPEGGGGPADVQEPGSPDKTNERFLFPER